jgi:hypothetical protein
VVVAYAAGVRGAAKDLALKFLSTPNIVTRGRALGRGSALRTSSAHHGLIESAAAAAPAPAEPTPPGCRILPQLVPQLGLHGPHRVVDPRENKASAVTPPLSEGTNPTRTPHPLPVGSAMVPTRSSRRRRTAAGPGGTTSGTTMDSCARGFDRARETGRRGGGGGAEALQSRPPPRSRGRYATDP